MVPAYAPDSASLQNVLRKISVFDEVPQMSLNHAGIDHNALVRLIWRLEAEVFEQPFQNGMQSARADIGCLLYTSPSPRDATLSRMPSSA